MNNWIGHLPSGILSTIQTVRLEDPSMIAHPKVQEAAVPDGTPKIFTGVKTVTSQPTDRERPHQRPRVTGITPVE
jgi:hypothetical protein